jgi:hypothetical protein
MHDGRKKKKKKKKQSYSRLGSVETKASCSENTRDRRFLNRASLFLVRLWVDQEPA